ncbi:tRNA dihydrouridine(20/20a) synthase DusA [Parvularcula marina]|uniref:tRNA-dihydrouridine(20/20a) synthase n=1 Tax=Parvularcula marina TaxID=2292771 RepID=A0A371RKR0_9PROT|nr:tRNA dihydrouridine(20/20a) synthase DusA [Parvularcula marina]RFB06052.1 tRNA dihydrouridine(20/20a) synthase DusA [Parvularcula marina]
MTYAPHRFCVAPMIDWTDRYCRFVHRQLSKHARLYTEMIVDEAILRGDRSHLLDFDTEEHPLALQLGGSDSTKMAAAAKIGAEWGYDEINMNIGCPSDRVQSGRFGACLMTSPDLVADCLKAMQDAVDIPVTAKCRIGVDDQEPAEILPRFIDRLAEAGVTVFIVHARKAWLDGLSPKENRTVPPLDYLLVEEVARARPHLTFVLNGGIEDLDQAASHLETFDGVMLGRAAYERPFILSRIDTRFFDSPCEAPDRLTVIKAVAAKAAVMDVPIWKFARHMLGLFHGEAGARDWRRRISEEGRDRGATPDWFIRLGTEITARSRAAA